MSLTAFFVLDDNVLSDNAWGFAQQADGLLTGTFEGKNYLLVREMSLETLAAVQVDMMYLRLVKKIPCQGAALVSMDLYFHILEMIAFNRLTDNQSLTSSVQRQLEQLLTHAVELDASDIHITRRDTLATIELRINGVLVPDMQMLAERCDEMVFVLYNVQASTRETTWNRNVPQSANILYTLAGKKYRFRYEHFPIFGERDECYHAVLRIIPAGMKKNEVVELSQIGVSAAEANDIRRMLSNPYGAYIIAGTTGSGKSSTLKVLMEWMQRNRFDNKGSFLTVEDPVEYYIAGARQSSVLDADKGGFHSAIKSSLRRDPDVLMVGEIRDPVSANALAGAVESGHYCFTTVHAGNIVTLLQRLVALNIGSDKLSTPGFIAGLQCQKLLPVICEHCKQPLENRYFGGRGFNVFVRNADGCEYCNYTGVTSRQLIIEYMRPNNDELESISGQQWFQVYKHWRAKRFVTDALTEGFDLRDKAMACVLGGQVCAKWFGMEFGDIATEDLEVLLEKIY